VLDRVESARAYADLALHAALQDDRLSARDRAFATELVYGTLRWRGRLDFALGACCDRPLGELEPVVRTLLRLGAYQLLFLAPVPPRAAIDESVRCAQAMGWARASGLVNAVLRQLARRRAALAFPELASDPLAHLVHALSLPEWIARRWLDSVGAEEAAALARAANETPPLTARVNPLATTREQLLAELAPRWPEARLARHAPLGLSLGHGDPGNDPAFREGRFTIQDEASQLVVEMLAPQPGEAVLDLCAAPGAKTTAIAERIGAQGLVVACDRNARRLELVGRAARRLGLGNVRLAHADGTQPLPPLPRAPFARVLVDAPCSGLGTLRRNPDARWRLRPEDPAALAPTQRALLECAARAVMPGGALVYSTCTLLAEENEAVIGSFLAAHAEFSPVARSELPEAVHAFVGADGFMRTWPPRHGIDGFFAARLARSREAKPVEARKGRP
jgi:16S rRNA (cytosine967-C5)-methyltransferase